MRLGLDVVDRDACGLSLRNPADGAVIYKGRGIDHDTVKDHPVIARHRQIAVRQALAERACVDPDQRGQVVLPTDPCPEHAAADPQDRHRAAIGGADQIADPQRLDRDLTGKGGDQGSGCKTGGTQRVVAEPRSLREIAQVIREAVGVGRPRDRPLVNHIDTQVRPIELTNGINQVHRTVELHGLHGRKAKDGVAREKIGTRDCAVTKRNELPRRHAGARQWRAESGNADVGENLVVGQVLGSRPLIVKLDSPSAIRLNGEFRYDEWHVRLLKNLQVFALSTKSLCHNEDTEPAQMPESP